MHDVATFHKHKVCYTFLLLLYLGKICDQPTIPIIPADHEASLKSSGWCASGSVPFLLIDLGKEYHITRVITMGDRDQTKWSDSYSLRYSHDKSLLEQSRGIQVICHFKLLQFRICYSLS